MLRLKNIVFKQFLDRSWMTPYKLCGNMLSIWRTVFFFVRFVFSWLQWPPIVWNSFRL